jgi:hypothetical protein
VVTAAPDAGRSAAAPDAGALAYAGPAPTPRLSAAFAKAQAEFPVLGFDSEAAPGTNRSYKYASLKAILQCVRPALNKHGISLRQSLTVTEGWVHCATTLSLAEEQWSDTFSMPAKSSNPHDIGSAATYAKRYALAAICAVAGEEGVLAEPPPDDDGHTAQATAERGTDPPRTPRRKAATSEHAPDPAAAAAPPLAASGSGTERQSTAGRVQKVNQSVTRNGGDMWVFKLMVEDGVVLTFSTFSPEDGAVLVEGRSVIVEWLYDKTGKYRNVIKVHATGSDDDDLPF